MNKDIFAYYDTPYSKAMAAIRTFIVILGAFLIGVTV